MGFWDNVGSWFGSASGATQTGLGEAGERAGQATMGQAANTLGNIAAQDPSAAAQKAIQTGQQLGEQQGRTAATQGQQQALQAARTAGLNKGQAAQTAGQQVSGLYTGGQAAGMGQGINAQQTAAAQQIGAASGQGAVGAAQSNAGLGAANLGQQQGKDFLGGVTGLVSGILNSSEENKENVDDDKSKAVAAPALTPPPAPAKTGDSGGSSTFDMMKGLGTSLNAGGPEGSGGGALNKMMSSGGGGGGGMGAIGGIASLASLFSDENAKTNLDEVAEKVPSHSYNYKPGLGEDPSKRYVGVMAQDLEKTSMKDNVIDTPKGKAIDVAKQTGSNTAMISEAAKRIKRLEAMIGGSKNAKS